MNSGVDHKSRARSITQDNLTRIFLVLVPFAVTGIATGAAGGQETSVVRAGNIEFRFATVDQGRQLLSQEDVFVRKMSPMDRKIRLRVENDPGPGEYLKLAASAVIEWPDDARAAVRSAIDSLDESLINLSLPDPGPVTLVHTTGREESGAAYTRGSVIVLPRTVVGSVDQPPRSLVAHELFHVLSRSDSQWRDELYAKIGFQAVGEIGLPDSLIDRKLTNPDAPVVKHVIHVRLSDQRQATVAPVLFAKSEFSPDKTSLFAYVEFKLMEVIQIVGKQWIPKMAAGDVVMHDPSIPDYHRQIGGNTTYIIHPEEILAVNFSMMVTGAEVKDQWVLDAMRQVMAR